MDELEQRLRSALTSMAEEVPPSHRAWDEQQRRLALKSRRHRFRPGVMAAVAAAAAVLIAAPIMIIQQANTPVNPGALPVTPHETEATASVTRRLPDAPVKPKYEPREGEVLVTQPMYVDGRQWDSDKGLVSYAYVVQKGDERRLCLAQIAAKATVINGSGHGGVAPECMVLAAPKPGRYEWGHWQVPVKFLTNETKGVWLYVMSRPAKKMMLRRAENKDLVPATTKEFGQDLVFFGAYLNSARPPEAYTLYDDEDKPFFNGP